MMSDSVMFVFFCFSCRVSETEFSDTTLVTKVMKCGQATLVEQVEGRLDYEVTIQQKVVTRNLTLSVRRQNITAKFVK